MEKELKTIVDLETATAQEVFDLVAGHLLKQNQRSIDSEGGCAYRGSNDLKCAAGFLLDDNIDFERIEGKNWESVSETLKITDKHDYLIRNLQGVHDARSPAEWKESLTELTAQYGLNTEIIKQYENNN